MNNKVSVVINTLNEENNIGRAILSVKGLASEVIVCDMFSEDKTVEVARKLGARIFTHQKTGYVEPARNFAISKASGDWLLILDADEEIPSSLADKLREIASSDNCGCVEVPRKNIIFGKWMKNSGWWPDFNTRFFKKGTVTWSDQIHSKPLVKGTKLTLEAIEGNAIVHHHYTSVGQYITRLNNYTSIQAKELSGSGYKFSWTDLIDKPLGEFLSRFFANRGYLDGLHGLALSFLQALSHLVVYLKLWEMEGFKEESLNLKLLQKKTNQSGKEIRYWFIESVFANHPLKKMIQKVRHNMPNL